jgi:hypothetical protein
MATSRIKRIYHPYWDWEDFKSGMWNKVGKESEIKMLPIAIKFTGNHIEYGRAMKRVIYEWPISCENNLTDNSINQKAWLGHAACSIELQIPEYIIRQAWKLLTDEQRILANLQAELYIRMWLCIHRKKIDRKQYRIEFEYET